MLELLLNPGKKRRSKSKTKARRARKSRKFMSMFRRPKGSKKVIRQRRWAAGTRGTTKSGLRGVGGMFTNPPKSIGAFVGTMKTSVLPLAVGVVGNMLLRPRLQSALKVGQSTWKNAAVGVGSAVILGIGAGLVARKHAAKIVMGALVQTAVTTVIEAKAGMTPAPVALPMPMPAAATVKGFDEYDAELSGYSPEMDGDPL